MRVTTSAKKTTGSNGCPPKFNIDTQKWPYLNPEIPLKTHHYLGNPTVRFSRVCMDVSENRVFPPKSSTLIGFSIINHPFWGYPHLWKHPYG